MWQENPGKHGKNYLAMDLKFHLWMPSLLKSASSPIHSLVIAIEHSSSFVLNLQMSSLLIRVSERKPGGVPASLCQKLTPNAYMEATIKYLTRRREWIVSCMQPKWNTFGLTKESDTGHTLHVLPVDINISVWMPPEIVGKNGTIRGSIGCDSYMQNILVLW